MSNFNVAVVAIAALLGGFWGWRMGTKRMYRRSVFAENGNSTRSWRRRRETQRYWLTVLYAAVCAGVIALLMMLAAR